MNLWIQLRIRRPQVRILLPHRRDFISKFFNIKEFNRRTRKYKQVMVERKPLPAFLLFKYSIFAKLCKKGSEL